MQQFNHLKHLHNDLGWLMRLILDNLLLFSLDKAGRIQHEKSSQLTLIRQP